MKSLKNSKSNKLHSKKTKKVNKNKKGGVNPFSFIGTKIFPKKIKPLPPIEPYRYVKAPRAWGRG